MDSSERYVASVFAVVAILGAALLFSESREATAQAPQPTMYLVTQDGCCSGGGNRVYWFETADAECYTYVHSISCLRKAQP